MALRIEDIARIGLVSSLMMLACSSDGPPDPGGSGGAGTSAGGMASAGTAGGGGSPSSAGTSTAGTSTAGTSTAGTATGGAGSGAGGSSASGSGGTSAGSGTGGSSGSGGSGGKSKTTFFVTSDTSKTGKLGGLEMADKRCQDLATKAGFGDHTFHAYLSTSTVNAKDRIGTGPWTNSLGTLVAADLTALHAAKGNVDVFGVDENKMKINGQWNAGTGTNEHDILTGSMPDGTVQAGKTCMDWTSDASGMTAQVGHCDGMGPGMATTGQYPSWNSSHENGGCNDTAPKGGAGRLYCFAIN
jgi:hypothetical protein